MAGRRLSELLKEQQEPFLLHGCGEAPCCSEEARRQLCVHGWKNGDDTRRRSALRRAVRRAARLAGCFSCGAHASFFRQLPRAGDTGGSHCDGAVTRFDDDDDDGGRRLSPVSVLDVLRYYSDEETHSSPTLSNREQDGMPSSTPGSSPPSSDLLRAGATSQPFTLHTAPDKTRARAGEDATTTTSEEEQMIISSWERIAGDILRVPALAELDLSSSGSAPEWRRLGLVEAARVGASIEAMIFEEVRAEAVRDMLEFSLQIHFLGRDIWRFSSSSLATSVQCRNYHLMVLR